jgi:hypothetical protein
MSTLPQSTTTNVDGEEIETFIDQSSNSFTDSVWNFIFIDSLHLIL